VVRYLPAHQAYLDWEKVTDPSLPLTYSLQIASDQNFTTIVVDKKGLPDSEYKGIDADEMKRLADAASLALVNALNPKHPVVSAPGPGVSRIKFAITDLKQSRPAVSAITTVIPVGLAISLVKKGAADEWTGGGLTKAEVMIYDSMTEFY
jgi:Flp pilus assembly CpaF family ATPase